MRACRPCPWLLWTLCSCVTEANPAARKVSWSVRPPCMNHWLRKASDTGRWFSECMPFCGGSLHHLLGRTGHTLLLVYNSFLFLFSVAKKAKAGNTPTGRTVTLFQTALNEDENLIHLQFRPCLTDAVLSLPQRRSQLMSQISLNRNAELISSNVRFLLFHLYSFFSQFGSSLMFH